MQRVENGGGVGQAPIRGRVLVLCFDNVGDVVFMSSLCRALSELPGVTSVDVLVKTYTRALASLLPGIRQVYDVSPFWDKSPGHPSGPFFSFWRGVWPLRKNNYQWAVIPNHCYRTAALAKLLGIRHRLGFLHGKNRWFLTHQHPSLQRDRPIVAQIASLMQVAGQPSAESQYSLELPSASPVELRQPLPERTVALHAFAGNPKRCAPLTLWLQFSARLQEAGFHTLWFGTEAEMEKIEALAGKLPAAQRLESYVANQFPDIAYLLNQVWAFVGHDSGPLHVAGGLGRPVLGLYLPSEPERTGPQGPGKKVLHYEKHRDDLSIENWWTSWTRLTEQIQAPSC